MSFARDERNISFTAKRRRDTRNSNAVSSDVHNSQSPLKALVTRCVVFFSLRQLSF